MNSINKPSSAKNIKEKASIAFANHLLDEANDLTRPRFTVKSDSIPLLSITYVDKHVLKLVGSDPEGFRVT